jgi:hypothetical protein
VIRSAALASVAAVLGTGCGEPPAPAIHACNVVEPACQRQVFVALEGLRGQIWDPWLSPPPVEVVTPEQHERRVERELGGAVISSGWNGSLQRLGVLAPGADVGAADRRWFVDNATAVYWYQLGRVSIVDRGRRFDDGEATGTLFHEYAHAAQDRDLDLGAPGSSITDREMVRKALIEGEAMVYQRLAVAAMNGTAPRDFDWDGYFRNWLAGERAATAASPSAHAHVRLSFPYPLGGSLLARAWLRAGRTGINQLFLAPPRASLDLMLDIEGRPAVAHHPSLPCPRARDPEGARIMDRDSLGAALFYAFLARNFGDDEEAWQAALTWRGDVLWLLSEDRARPALTFWKVHAPDLRATSLGRRLEGRTVPPVLDGEHLLFWDSADAAQVDRMKVALVCE